MHNKKICNRCVMDTSDPRIQFDKDGFCNHCTRAKKLLGTISERPENALSQWAETLRTETNLRGKQSIIGLSGGVDSCYLALLLSQFEIKPLVVHVDAGWNTEVAATNIRKVVDVLKLDLETIVINWKEMRSVQTAFLRAGIRNQDIPQDHVFFTALYEIASRYRIRHVITGANLATESILPTSWGSDAMDGRFLLSVLQSQGVDELRHFPVSRLPHHYVTKMALGRMIIHKPLNMISYNKGLAINELKQRISWREYGGKHSESLFTAWYQYVYLVRRFGIDKRKAHLSSLIISGQISRELALVELDRPALTENEERILSSQIARKLGLLPEELARLSSMEVIDESQFSSDQWIYSSLVTSLGRLFISRGNEILRNISVTR